VAAFCSAPPVLTAQDLSYLGYYDVQTNGQDTTYSQSLTHRYVNGQLRFLNLQLRGQLHEFSVAGKNYGDVISTITNHWDLSAQNLLYDFNGLWWEEARARLWITGAVDYTANNYDSEIHTLALNTDGTYSGLKVVTLAGLPMKRTYGGVQPVPTWFQSQYGVGPYVVGWGGYTSLVAQGGGASMGPTMYAMPDPTNLANGAAIQWRFQDHYGLCSGFRD
jgi:hypothetical protein